MNAGEKLQNAHNERLKVSGAIQEQFHQLVNDKKSGLPVIWNGIEICWSSMSTIDKINFIEAFWFNGYVSRKEMAWLLGISVCTFDTFKRNNGYSKVDQLCRELK